ncbi:MAG: hypothetical protein HY226_06410 [Candidatus Vogelbacteria bacterium]|nr:hypothetical protein [Candidatus Vogelbacteria bacterium]
MKSNFIVSVYRKNWINGAKRLFLAEPYVHHVLEKNGELQSYDEIQLAPYFRKNREELIRDHNFVDQKYQKYVPILASRLNKIHNTNYDDFFWKKCLALGLIRYITLFYQTYQVCESCFSIEMHDCRVLSERSYHISNDFDEHRDFFQCTAYGQEQIFSIYMSIFHPDRFESVDDKFSWPILPMPNSDKRISFLGRIVRKLSTTKPAKIVARIASKIYRLRTPRVGIIESYFSIEHLNDLIMKSNGLIQPIALNRNFSFDSDVSWDNRELISQTSSDFDRFDRFFFASLKYCLPKVFIEEFTQVYTHYDKYFKRFRKLKFVVNESWIGFAYAAFAMAILQKQGTKHIYNEHNFLSHQFLCNNHKYIISLVDKFVTLGWHDQSIANLVRGGSLREWLADAEYPKEYEILFVSGQPAVKAPEFNASYGDFGAFNAQRHLKFDLEFFSALKRSTIRTVVYRGYPVDDFVVAHVQPPMYAYDQEYVLKEYVKEFKLIDNHHRSAKELMQQSRLIVIDYLSTSYIESMLADIPTIFFWNEEICPLGEDQMDFYKSLIEVGICQTNPVRGAQFIESIKNSPEKWWQLKPVQDAKNNFLDNNFGDPIKLKNQLLNLADESVYILAT